jgi:hypothetical protein
MSEHRIDPPERAAAPRLRNPRRLLVLLAALLLPLSLASASFAATNNTVKTPGGLTAVGPVDPATGFPTWYQDSNNTRVEPCLDQDNPLCGFLPGDVPEPGPIVFPDNFPEEFFYQLASSELTLPGGGRAVLTLGVEGAFANAVQPGDQLTFARTRIVVKNAAVPDGELTFQTPFGTAKVDIVGGAGKLVEDLTPIPGDFTSSLKGKFGPFLKWTTGAPDGYLGDPAQPHAVTGGTNGNSFSVTGTGITTTTTTDQFTINGKIATNTGVQGDAAVVHGSFVDVYATSRGDRLEVTGSGIATTPMAHDPGSERHYARVEFSGSPPSSVDVTNLTDNPASKVTIKVSDISITSATYDGLQLSVTATGSGTLTATGFGPLTGATTTFPAAAPPLTVTVTSSGGSSATYPVSVTGGPATPAGQPPAPPGGTTDCTNTASDGGAATGAGCTNGTGGTTTPGAPTASATAAAASVLRGTTTTLDGSASTGVKTYAWSQDSGPAVTFSAKDVAKPTITAPVVLASDGTSKAPADTAAMQPGDAVLRLTVTGSDGSTTATTTVTVAVTQDTVAVTTNRQRIGQELRVGGTSLINGRPATLTPPTRVYVWDVTKATPTLLGTAQVDTLGAWDMRLKPGPTATVTTVLVQSSRGGGNVRVTLTR